MKKKVAEYGFLASVLAVPIVAFICFWCATNLNSILLAFQKRENGIVTFTLSNFELMFQDIMSAGSVFNESLGNTLIFFCVSVFVMVPLTLVFSFLLNAKIPLYRAYRFIFYLPTIVPVTVMTIVFKYLIGPDGPIDEVYRILGDHLPAFLSDSRYAMKTLVFYSIWTGFGVNLILFMSAMNRVPQECLEAARIDGIGFWGEFFKIILPLIWPTITTVLTLALTNLFNSSGPILLLTEGRGKTDTISYWIFDMVYQQFNYEYSAAVGVFFTLIGLPIILLGRKILTKLGSVNEY